MTRFVPAARGMVLLVLLAALASPSRRAPRRLRSSTRPTAPKRSSTTPRSRPSPRSPLAKRLRQPDPGGFRAGAADRHISAQLYAYEEAIASRDDQQPAGAGRHPRHRPDRPAAAASSTRSSAPRRTSPGSSMTPPSTAASRRARSPRTRRSPTSRPTLARPSPGSPRPRMATSRPAARRRCGCSTSSPHAPTAPTCGVCSELDVFVDPARNPDGRDQTTPAAPPGASIPNRDLMYQTQDVNQAPLDEIYQVPGPVLHRRPPAGRRATSSRPTRTRSTTRSRTSRWTTISERDRSGAAGALQRPEPAVPQLQRLRPLRPRVRRHRPRADPRRRRDDLREGQQRELRQAGLRPLPGDGRDAQRRRQGKGQAARRLDRAVAGGGRTGRELRAPGRTRWSARCTTRSPSSPTSGSAATTSSRACTPATPRTSSTCCSNATSTSTGSTSR